MRLEEINFKLTKVKNDSEIDYLIDEKEKAEKQLHKNNPKTSNSIDTQTKSNKENINLAIKQIGDLKFKNLQEPFID